MSWKLKYYYEHKPIDVCSNVLKRIHLAPI